MLRGIFSALLLLTSGISCSATDLLFRKDSITVFGGVYTTVSMVESISPAVPHDTTYLVAGAYRREFVKLPWNIVLGAEIGLGLRFGDGRYGEIWAAPTARVTGIPLGESASMSIGLAAGFSAITNPTDLEREKEFEHSGNSKVLFYFSPEFAFAFKQWANMELVFRLHHRSGLYGTLGRMKEGANAHVIGLRWSY